MRSQLFLAVRSTVPALVLCAGCASIEAFSANPRTACAGDAVTVTWAAVGDVTIGSAGEGGTIRSASGDIQIEQAAGRVTVQTASGDLNVGAVAEGEVDAKSASGDVQVGIREGSRLTVDARSMSGDTTSEIELGSVEVGGDGPLVRVKAATMSGDIRIVRA